MVSDILWRSRGIRGAYRLMILEPSVVMAVCSRGSTFFSENSICNSEATCQEQNRESKSTTGVTLSAIAPR